MSGQGTRRASIEAITSGAAIFAASVGFLTARNQFDNIGQAVGVTIIGFLVAVWVGIFGIAPIRSAWALLRQRMRTEASLNDRIEVLERKHSQLTASWVQESQNVLAMLSLLESSTNHSLPSVRLSQRFVYGLFVQDSGEEPLVLKPAGP